MARFVVDPDASSVAVSARTTTHPVRIKARGLNGFLDGQLDPDGRVKLRASHHAWLSIPVSELRSGNPLQDIEMDRRLEAGRYPSIDCEVDRLTDNGAGGYRASARLMVHGVSRAVDADVTVSARSSGEVLVEAQHTFDMRDFGVRPPNLLVLRMEPEVGVTVKIVARRQG